MTGVYNVIATSKKQAFDLVCEYISNSCSISIDDAKRCLVEGILNDGGEVVEIKLKTKSGIKSIYYTYCFWLL